MINNPVNQAGARCPIALCDNVAQEKNLISICHNLIDVTDQTKTRVYYTCNTHALANGQVSIVDGNSWGGKKGIIIKENLTQLTK